MSEIKQRGQNGPSVKSIFRERKRTFRTVVEFGKVNAIAGVSQGMTIR